MHPARKRFYEEPWFQVWAWPLALLAIYLLLQLIPGATVASWLVDVIAVAMMFFVTLALASQFVLPVRTLRERRLAYERMLAYVSSVHGPILFIRDGELVGNLEELKRRGTGVILVDGSSAVVLERQRRFSRAEGPGIVFTKYGERLAATFDLRKQSRALETQALTKDGIEIKATISVTFALDPGDQASPRETPDERDALGYARITPAFPFNPDSAFKAYYGFAVTGDQNMLKWTELPTMVATEYFRDMVSRKKLDELFQHDHPGSSPISAMQTLLTEQVQKASLLRERGIKIYRVGIGTLDLPPEVSRQWLQAWAARWEKEALITLSTAQATAEELKERAKTEAQFDFLSRLRDYFKQAFQERGDSLTKQQIARRIAEELHSLTEDPITRMMIPYDTLRRIDNFRTWAEVPDQTTEPHIIGENASEDLSELVAEDIPQPDDSGALDQADGATVQNNGSDDSKESSSAAGGLRMKPNRRRPTRKDFTLRLLGLFYNLLEGDHVWAERRSILLWTAVLIFFLMGRATERITDWWLLQPYIDALPAPVVLALSLLHPQTLRHALPPIIGMFLALGMAANYVRDLFELADLATGSRYLNAAMFASGYPSINIRNGNYEGAEGAWGLGANRSEMDTNPIPKIGGPGYVSVSPGNVALFERVGGPSKVAGAGWHFIRRFETLREVVDLRDQFRERAEVKATTKDGLPVIVQNVQVSFRVRTSNRPRTQQEAYPFSISAVRGIAYGKTVSAKGPSLWTDSVPNTVASTIRDYISRSFLDDLITGPEVKPPSPGSNGQPPAADDKTQRARVTLPTEKQKDPRDKLKAVLESKETRHKFNAMGVELLWVSLGHIKTPTDVLDEYTNTWGAKWRGEALKKQAEGDAHKLRAMDTIRAFARLGLVGEMMKSVPVSPERPPNFDIVLLQIAETLSFTTRHDRDFSSRAHRTSKLTDVEMAMLNDPNSVQLLNQMGFGGGGSAGGRPALSNDEPPLSST